MIILTLSIFITSSVVLAYLVGSYRSSIRYAKAIESAVESNWYARSYRARLGAEDTREDSYSDGWRDALETILRELGYGPEEAR